MKSLILPDVHNHHTIAEKIIASVKPDQTILLGDYFDDFQDTIADVYATAEWFKWSVNQKDRIHLTGNHDIHYWFEQNHAQRCSGFDIDKSKCINDIVKPEDWKKLKFYSVLDDWILSHAGVHPYWIDPMKARNNEPVTITKDALTRKLERDSTECIKSLEKGRGHWFTISGFSRSASPFVGGLLWCDFNQEFEPILGIHQIIGHTPDRYDIKWKFIKENDPETYDTVHGCEPVLCDKTSYNVCFDSYPALKWYAIYEDKSLKFHETKNL